MTNNTNNTGSDSEPNAIKYREGVDQLKHLFYSLSAFELTVEYDGDDDVLEVTTENGGKVRITFSQIKKSTKQNLKEVFDAAFRESYDHPEYDNAFGDDYKTFEE